MNEFKVIIIKEYIHAKKGVWIEIAEPDTPERWDLFEAAFQRAMYWRMYETMMS